MRTQISKILKLLVILLTPVLIVSTTVRLLTTDQYLAFEYGRASFPPDPYGFTERQRFILASTNIHYVRAHLPNNELSNQTLNGNPVYNTREVAHMADVRTAFQVVFKIWQAAFVLILLMGFILWRKGEREIFGSAIQKGGILTAGIILSIALAAVFAWQPWFNALHLLFFKPGSWLFSYSDTLIRLFPVQFWFDATLTVSAFSLIGGLLMTFIGWQWRVAIKNTQIARI